MGGRSAWAVRSVKCNGDPVFGAERSNENVWGHKCTGNKDEEYPDLAASLMKKLKLNYKNNHLSFNSAID